MIDASVSPVPPVLSSKSVLVLVLVDLGDVLLYLGIRDTGLLPVLLDLL